MAEASSDKSGVSRRRVLGLAAFAAVAGLLAYRQTDPRPVYPGGSLTVEDAHAMAVTGEIVLIDIRRPDEWERTGIGEGAVPLDMRRPDFEAKLAILSGPTREIPVALICARGVRSARLGRRLAAAGFDSILDVPQGMLGSAAGPGWLERGLPVRAYTEQG